MVCYHSVNLCSSETSPVMTLNLSPVIPYCQGQSPLADESTGAIHFFTFESLRYHDAALIPP